MFCKNCGKEIDDNSKFCQYCGAKIVEPNSKKEFVEALNKIRYCPKCKNKHQKLLQSANIVDMI